MQSNDRGTNGYVCKVPVECTGMPGERMGVGANCQRMQGMVESQCKVQGEYRVMQGNARGMHGSGCKVPWECRGMPGESMGVCSASGMQGNSRECQGNVWEWA